GYTVRTTVRSLSREPQVRATVGSEVDPGDRLTVLAANLTSEEGWPEAVAGCDYVLHVASPFPPKQPKDPDELILPAREGTLRVLRTSLDAGVNRVVVTSSVAAIRLGVGAALSPKPAASASSRPPSSSGWVRSERSCASASERRPRRCPPGGSQTCSCGAWRCLTPVFAPSSADSASAPSSRRRRRGARSAGPR